MRPFSSPRGVSQEVARAGKKTPAQEEATKLRAKMLEKGVLIGLGGARKCTMRMQPCLNITNEQVDKVIDTFEETLRRL